MSIERKVLKSAIVAFCVENQAEIPSPYVGDFQRYAENQARMWMEDKNQPMVTDDTRGTIEVLQRVVAKS